MIYLKSQRLVALAKTIIIAAFLSISIAGCAIPTPNDPPDRLYVLSPKSTFDAATPHVDWQLGVSKPYSSTSLNSAKIAVVRDPLSIEYFADALWEDDAPSMVQRLIIESFQNSGKIVGVGQRAIGLRSDYLLNSELREFQAEYNGDGPPKVRVEVNAILVEMPRREIVAFHTAERVVQAKDNRMISIIQAFDKALGKVLADLVEWALAAPGKVE